MKQLAIGALIAAPVAACGGSARAEHLRMRDGTDACTYTVQAAAGPPPGAS